MALMLDVFFREAQVLLLAAPEKINGISAYNGDDQFDQKELPDDRQSAAVRKQHGQCFI